MFWHFHFFSGTDFFSHPAFVGRAETCRKHSVSRPAAPSPNDTLTSFMRRGAKGEERGGRGSVWRWVGGTGGGGSRGRGHISRLPRQRLSVNGVPRRNGGDADSWTSRRETPNKQRLSHQVIVGGDKLRRRPLSCHVANHIVEACGGETIRGDTLSLVLLEEAAVRLTATRKNTLPRKGKEGGGGGAMLTSSLCAVLCGHRRTESRLQQMSCGADYK